MKIVIKIILMLYNNEKKIKLNILNENSNKNNFKKYIYTQGR